MPHALSMPAPGFQAIILCGPGSSFPTFTANPDENPKALIPIANRPMVWYPLEFCYRMGVTSESIHLTVKAMAWLDSVMIRDKVEAAKFLHAANVIVDITLITPPSSAAAIAAALKTNPHLTGLPLPKPDLLAPKDLTQNTGTAEIFRLPEVRNTVKGDFIVLPCDLVCELGGETLLESWMVKEAGLGGATGGGREVTGPKMAIGGEKGGRRGGIGVWYETKGETVIKGEETDFIATSPLEPGPVPPASSSTLNHVSNLIYSVPTDTLNDITEDKKSLPIRHRLLRAHPRVRMLSSHRDAHIYIFPAWVMDMINNNEHMDSIGEDVLGWWAKAGWQDGLGEKLRLREIFCEAPPEPDELEMEEDNLLGNNPAHDNVDFGELCSTWTTELVLEEDSESESEDAEEDDEKVKKIQEFVAPVEQKLVVPPILAYIHPKNSKLIRRVDTTPLLLNVSLPLAKLDSIEAVGKEAASPFAHQLKITSPEIIAQKSTVTRPDCLLAHNVTVEEKAIIKESVIGANCTIKTGARLTRCVLMDGVVVGKGCRLTGCIIGRHAEIGEESSLQDCEVQEKLFVEPQTEDKGNKLMSSEGMEATEAEIQEFVEDEAAMIDAAGTGFGFD